MQGLVGDIASPWWFIAALLVFGFFPRLLLRLIVLAFHRDDPRRSELLGELDVIPYVQRPLFVAEQFEVAIVEGFGGWLRFVWVRKVTARWSLTDGIAMNRDYPDSFGIPDFDEKASLQPGDHAKLGFNTRDGWGERMWVRVEKRTRRGYVGRLSNLPVGIPDLWPDKKVRFRSKHVIDIHFADEPEHGAPRAGT